jgi:hypothetical protein
MALQIGQQIRIPCKVQPGPFAEEPLVTFDSIDGPVSGFVRNEELEEVAGQPTIRVVIRAIEKDHLEVWIRGSFFTTNGLANVSTQLAMAA